MSSYASDLESGMDTKETIQTCDACKPVRKTFNAVVKSLGRSKILTSVFVLIPMVFMLILLMYFELGIQNIYFQGHQYDFQPYKSFLSPPVILVSSLTFIAGTFSLLSIYFGFQNITGMCSFVYCAIAYWAIINTLIILFCTWNYLNSNTIGYGFLCSSIASFIWLFSSAVMDAHRKVVSDGV